MPVLPLVVLVSSFSGRPIDSPLTESLTTAKRQPCSIWLAAATAARCAALAVERAVDRKMVALRKGDNAHTRAAAEIAVDRPLVIAGPDSAHPGRRAGHLTGAASRHKPCFEASKAGFRRWPRRRDPGVLGGRGLQPAPQVRVDGHCKSQCAQRMRRGGAPQGTRNAFSNPLPAHQCPPDSSSARLGTAKSHRWDQQIISPARHKIEARSEHFLNVVQKNPNRSVTVRSRQNCAWQPKPPLPKNPPRESR